MKHMHTAALRALVLILLAAGLPGVASAQGFAEANGTANTGDDMDLTLNAGGTLTYGNANAGGFNVSGNYTVRSGMELFVAEAAYIWGIAGTFPTCADVRAGTFPDPTIGGVGFCGTAMMPTDQPGTARAGDALWRENASNLTWRLRYDHFFDADNALFVAHRGRVDVYAGLLPRLTLQVGYNRMLFREENHTLAMDIGVDATVDLYTDNVRAQNQLLVDMGTALPNLAGTDARFVPALRVQLAYVNHINSVFTYDTTFEALWDVPNPTHFRFEWVNKLRSAIDTWLQVSLDLTFRLDSLPPGQAVAWEQRFGQTTTMFDMLGTLNLVGSFDLDGEPPAADEAPACPECPVCPTCADEAPAEAAPAAEPAPDAAAADTTPEAAGTSDTVEPATDPATPPG